MFHVSGNAEDLLKIIIVGDFGETVLQGQEKVAASMAAWAETNEPDWILSVGDNFYPKGIRSTTDPQIDFKWRNMYSNDSLADLNWQIILGNHDFGDWDGVEWNQIELGKIEPRWIIPHLWYDFTVTRSNFSAHFIIIDTESFTKSIESNNYTDMLPWFDRVLHESTADWKFVVGHRHIFSAGDHGPVTSSLYNVFVPKMEQYNVDAYICGHDHNLQHMQQESKTGLDYILSGSGGAGLYLYKQANADHIKTYYGIDSMFFKSVYGFTTLTLSSQSAVFDFYNKDDEVLYTYTRNKNIIV